MKLMSGLLKADQGSVIVANQDVTRPLGMLGWYFRIQSCSPGEQLSQLHIALRFC